MAVSEDIKAEIERELQEIVWKRTDPGPVLNEVKFWQDLYRITYAKMEEYREEKIKAQKKIQMLEFENYKNEKKRCSGCESFYSAGSRLDFGKMEPNAASSSSSKNTGGGQSRPCNIM